MLVVTRWHNPAIGDAIGAIAVFHLHFTSAVPVADAVDDIKPYVDYVARRQGGRGAVREICDFLLKKSGLWAGVATRYFED